MAESENKVFEVKYLIKLRGTFDSIGIWPNKQFGNNSIRSQILLTYKWLIILICFLGMISQTIYVKKHIDEMEFIELGQSFIATLICVVYLQRFSLTTQNRYCDLVKKFILQFHLIHHKHKSDIYMKVYNQVEKICTIATLASHYQMYMGAAMYNLVPLYNNYKTGMFSSERPINGTFIHSLYFELPIDQYTNTYHYILMFVYNCYLSYNVGCIFCIFDLMISLKVFHVWGHFNVFLHNLYSFPLPKTENRSKEPLLYTNDENNEVFIRLKHIIEHHKMIKEFVNNTSAVYSISMCVYYAFHLVTDGVLLLECAELDSEALGKYGPLTLILFQQLIQVSVVFELISSKGAKVPDAVYGLPWEYMDIKNRKIVLFFLKSVQKPLALKAGDMVPVGVSTMARIIKTTCSCFVMLNTFAKE